MISIITVVYNGADALEKTICSVVNQLGAKYEYIIIDGGSSDGTLNIIKRYERQITYWESKTDKGIYDAMNKGISYSTGDIIAFINCGDWYIDDCLSNVEEWFKCNNVDILICGVSCSKNGKIVGRKIPELDYISKKIKTGMPCCHQGIFAKAKWLKSSHNFDTKYRIVADYDWLLRCYYEGARIQCANMIVANYDLNGISAKNERMLFEEMKKSSLERLDKSFLENSEKNQIRNRIYQLYQENIETTILKEHLENKKVEWEKIMYLPRGMKYSIFGSGYIGEECCRLMKKLGTQVICIWDNDSTKWGKQFMGKEICNPQNILQDDSVIIIASTIYEEQIEDQLKKQYGRKREQYIFYRDIRHEIGQKLIKYLDLAEKKIEC